MRRAELIAGLENLREAGRESGLLSLWEKLRTTSRGVEESLAEAGPELAHSLHLFSIRAHSFGPVELKIAELFKFTPLTDGTVWSLLIPSKAPRGVGLPDLWLMLHQLNTVYQFLGAVLSLLTPEYKTLDPRVLAQSVGGEVAPLTIIVLEASGQLSTANRIARAIEGTIDLYEACATLEGANKDSLYVGACDSGSDKSFDFLGLASVVQGVKEIIIGLWDRVLFHREKKLELRANVVAQSLPILERIGALEENGRLPREQAEILRRGIVNGAVKLLEVGVTIPEVETVAVVSVRALMTPEPKYLMAPASTVEGTSPGHTPPGGPLKKPRRPRKPKPAPNGEGTGEPWGHTNHGRDT